MSGHTPGPWTDKAIDESQWGVYDSRGWSVAQAHQIKVLSADIKQAERTANARLIAAAPDLLEALMAMVEGDSEAIEDANMMGIPFPDEMLKQFKAARAAIAKATGVQP